MIWEVNVQQRLNVSFPLSLLYFNRMWNENTCAFWMCASCQRQRFFPRCVLNTPHLTVFTSDIKRLIHRWKLESKKRVLSYINILGCHFWSFHIWIDDSRYNFHMGEMGNSVHKNTCSLRTNVGFHVCFCQLCTQTAQWSLIVSGIKFGYGN